MSSPQLRLLMDEKIIVDLFAGGGGMSVAMEMAVGFLRLNAPELAVRRIAA